MTAGKRLGVDDPLTEHDVADRLNRATLRVLRILMDARDLGLAESVKGSRFHTNSLNALRSELDAWGIQPIPITVNPMEGAQ